VDFFNESGSSRSVQNSMGDTTALNSFMAASVTPHSPDVLWDELGINDVVAQPSWSMANFIAAKIAFWEAVHTAFPSCVIYAQTMTPCDTSGSPSTVADYRQAIRDAQAARSGWVTLVDWATIYDYTTSTTDNIHPNDTGAATLLAAARTVLGV
jgi:lysophospholipase L1-like esterase